MLTLQNTMGKMKIVTLNQNSIHLLLFIEKISQEVSLDSFSSYHKILRNPY